MLKKFENFLFDLDGTIIEPKESITKSIQYAMSKLGYEPPVSDELEWCIGPPLYSSFPILLGLFFRIRSTLELINGFGFFT